MKNEKAALVCGMLGCLCFSAGDWLMMYGDPACAGKLSWLTAGTAQIPVWRYHMAMALAFPGIILYGIALFAIAGNILPKRDKKIYRILNAFGLTPWIALHLFYIMILVLYAWMSRGGYAAESLAVCEGLYTEMKWFVPVCEVMMLPVFLWWFYLVLRGRTVYLKKTAFANVLIIFAALKGLSLLMPVSAFRLGFTNGLMSESMLFWFMALMIPGMRKNPKTVI